VLEFRQKYGKIVYKSISGVRSIVHTLEDSDLERLSLISWCPVQFQQYLDGENIRVHVINSHVFATAVNTTTTDYRYAHTEGGETKLRAIELPQGIQEQCINLSNVLGLAFSGIDLKLTPNNEFYCFEINPSPAYSYYEGNTGQPISKAVASYLAGIE
jgi:glutathione synthase/RimK-type ligase-like ATP-grasp enzyme